MEYNYTLTYCFHLSSEAVKDEDVLSYDVEERLK